MKKLFLICAVLLSTSSFAAMLMPKYECDLNNPEYGETSQKSTIYVSEDFLCGSENTKYEMAMVTPGSENDPLGSVDTGSISYSSDFKVTATLKATIEGKAIEMPIIMDLARDGKKNNSTFKVVVDIDENGKPQFLESKVTCSSTVQYNMDC